MATKSKECPSCAMEVDKKHKTCPVCGHEFEDFGKGIRWVAAALLIIIVIWILL